MISSQSLKSKFDRNKALWLECFVMVFIWGMAAHGYMLLNNSISHDSLNEFVSTEGVLLWKIRLGRVFYPAYQFVARGFITLPWLIGLLSLCYIAVAAFLVAKLFGLKKLHQLLILTGIMTVNVTVIAETASYINDLDGNMFALLMSVIAVWLWRKRKLGWLWGALILCGAMGIYQSYISVAIALIMLLCIMDLLRGEKARAVLTEGMKGIFMLLIAGVLYYLALKLIVSLASVEILHGRSNSLDTATAMSITDILKAMKETWCYSIYCIAHPTSVFSNTAITIISISLAIVTLAVLLHRILSKKMGLWETLICLALIALLPLGMNISRVLTNGMSHDLMHYALWFAYLFVMLTAEQNAEYCESKKPQLAKAPQLVCTALIAVLLLSNVRLANEAYLVKDFEYDANLSLFTRITAKLEAQEDYVAGETELAFVGSPEALLQSPEEYAHVRSLTGMWSPCATSYTTTYLKYCEYILMLPNPVVSADRVNALAQTGEVKSMPTFPAEGCMKLIDGIMVIKLG